MNTGLPDYSETAAATAFAGGVITLELVDMLNKKGVLTPDEARTVLERALRSLVVFSSTPVGPGAMRLISSLIETKLARRPA
jgi:hypothetical protein